MALSPAQIEEESRGLENRLNGTREYKPAPYESSLTGPNVYIFNIFPASFTVRKGSLGVFVIPACVVGQKVSKPLILDPWPSSSFYDVANDCMKLWHDEGKFVAQDIVHPAIGNDWSFGQNLDDYGVFWTMNKVPTDAELIAAREKMENYFRMLLNEATKMETNDTLDKITPHMRIADTYFNPKSPARWNSMHLRPEACVFCGGPTKTGVIIHSCGNVLNYRLAVERGARFPNGNPVTKADVPIAERWWTDEIAEGEEKPKSKKAS